MIDSREPMIGEWRACSHPIICGGTAIFHVGDTSISVGVRSIDEYRALDEFIKNEYARGARNAALSLHETLFGRMSK